MQALQVPIVPATKSVLTQQMRDDLNAGSVHAYTSTTSTYHTIAYYELAAKKPVLTQYMQRPNRSTEHISRMSPTEWPQFVSSFRETCVQPHIEASNVS